MNFFESQQRARSNTSYLVILFSLAIISLIIITNLFVILVWAIHKYKESFNFDLYISEFSWQLFFYIGASIIAFILIAILYKRHELAIGGKVIAENLGGTLIPSNTQDLKQRQLLNVVEEIAIASGCPVPPVYLIKENAINAFAAGFNINDAVIGITEGAIKNLNRNELQGIIAHEFGHVFNGDMRLNIEIISVLHGILVIGICGRVILENTRHGTSRSGKKGEGIIIFVGLGLFIIGYLGILFGNIIKACISRQREYLADASAVQFTRNPVGIGNALKKIASLKEGSKILNPKALEISHAFFAQIFTDTFDFFMATHPPISDRILRIDPYWDGETMPLSPKFEDNINEKKITRSSPIPAIAIATSMVSQNIGNIGNINQKSINQAHDFLISIPQNLKTIIHDSSKVTALIYSFLVSRKDKKLQQEQYEILKNNFTDPGSLELIKKLYHEIGTIDKEHYLSVVAIAIPTLKQLSNSEYQNFKNNISFLVKSNNKINLFKWSLEKLLFNTLERQYNKNYTEKKPIYNLQAIRNEVSLFLSLMAINGNKNEEEAMKVLKKAAITHNLIDFPFKNKHEITLKALDQSIIKLEQLKPFEKEKLLKICVTCINYDGKILQAELNLLRTFSAILNCPMPLIKD